MKLAATLALGQIASANKAFPKPLKYEPGSFDFEETDTEKDNGWSMANRCGGVATAGSSKDQRNDPNCPNVLLINTDDMAWGDVSANNPSKLIPTPNLDKMVSGGINFRDGHSCTARCAPSRYCLMTGRYHFRRGDYHYKPMELEYGRKVLTHLFKRNNYKTMVVGKPQPVEAAIATSQPTSENPDPTDFFFIEGTGFWGYDRSFTSRSYCCLPGGGYFVNDLPRKNFDKWAIFSDFRVEDEGSVQISGADEAEFWQTEDKWHLLDGYTKEHTGTDGPFRPTTYMAYWNAIGMTEKTGRRRRDVDGRLMRRATVHNRKRRTVAKNQAQNIIDEVHEHRFRRSRKTPEKSYVRFQHKQSGKVLVATTTMLEGADRSNYEFAAKPGDIYDKLEDAQKATDDAIAACDPKKNTACNDLKKSVPKRTQEGFDSRAIMRTFSETAQQYIREHVQTYNPKMANGNTRDAFVDEKTDLQESTNQPFFMYLSFRAPHRPYSHEYVYNPEDPDELMPYTTLGKPGEQLGLFDRQVGNVMLELKKQGVENNTLIFFTSDNGPDQGAFNIFNKLGHMRMVTMRGKKASVYEGGHRVPFLSWWPLGTHPALLGTNFDLPVGQVDFFATFADILNYPLPNSTYCTYAFNSETAAISGRDPTILGRPKRGKEQRTFAYENAPIWTQRVWNYTTNPCLAKVGVKQRASRKCEWRTCEECKQFWDDEIVTDENSPFNYRTADWMAIQKNVFCIAGAGMKCLTDEYGYDAEVQMKTGIKLNYLKEIKNLGYKEAELWYTKEQKTGYMLGWNGCMAEDSQSFADAFKAKDVSDQEPDCDKDGNCYKTFTTKLDRVPSRIYAGKLGDLSLRLGRYKLVRFNAPKDRRTGPTRQHLNKFSKHEGTAWVNAGKPWNKQATLADRCWYDDEGNSMNPSCTIEPLCRNHTTFDAAEKGPTCMRDHFYQLWDLERNFGEKVFCENSLNPRMNANLELEEVLKLDGHLNKLGSSLARFDMGASGTKDPEKPSDKYGYGLGIESTPMGEWTNDCCILNHDEKPKVDPETIDMCSQMRIKKGPLHNGFDSETGISYDDDRKEWTGGSCIKIRLLKKGDGTLDSFKAWTAKHKDYIYRRLGYGKHGWNDETHFSRFDELSEDNWEYGYGCSGVALGKPNSASKNINNQVIWDDKLKKWRHASMADKFCKPPKKADPEDAKFELSCKVKDHNGPLGEGWENNKLYKSALKKSFNDGRYDPNVADGEVKAQDFGKWADLVNCMKGALQLIEGQAYYPETREEIKDLGKANYLSTIFENELPVMDGPGKNGKPSPYEGERPLSGRPIGDSIMAQKHAEQAWEKIEGKNAKKRRFHGGGSRYIEVDDGSDALIAKCIKYIPKNEPGPYKIQPNYDLDNSLLGIYDVNDQTGGQNTKLKCANEKCTKFVDDRQKRKYYNTDADGNYLFAFEPNF